jgi:hypothetical protein
MNGMSRSDAEEFHGGAAQEVGPGVRIVRPSSQAEGFHTWPIETPSSFFVRRTRG